MLIEELLQRREDRNIEFKRDTSSLRGILEDYGAAANTADSWIVVGIDDDRNVIGVEDPQADEEKLSQAIYDNTRPPQSPRIVVVTHEGKELVLIEARFVPGPELIAIKRKGDWIVYERVGSTSVPVTDPDRLEQMRRERRGRQTFDQFPTPGATLADLDLDEARAKFAEAGIELDDAGLKTYGLATESNGKLVPTQAGVVLFGKDPNRFLPDARFRVIRYGGATKADDVIDQDDYRDTPLLQGIDQVVAFIRRNTGAAQVMAGRRHRNVPHYSETVIREVLHNAVAHADYSETGRHLNISVFSDRIQVDSPGKMPVGMTIQQLIEGVSQIRNRAVVRIMHELGYVEERGTVYAKARATEKKEGYPIPEWDQPGQLVRVTIRPHPAAKPSAVRAEEVSPRRRRNREQEIIDFLKSHPNSKLSEIGDAVGLRERQTRKYTSRLEQEGRIESSAESEFDPTKVFRVRSEPGT